MVYKRLERFLIQLDKVGSTNDYANDLIKTTQVANGTIIFTNHQSKGRGQRSNTWTTEEGKNLTCSIILHLDISVRHAFYLNIISSLSVRKALSDLGLKAVIKWPNDVLIGNEKVSGILVENQVLGDRIKSSIIGIGVNVNQKNLDNFFQTTSIIRALKQETDVLDVLDQIHGYLDFYLNLLLESNYELLLKHYYDFMFLLNKSAQFEDKDGFFEGIILGIDESGKLKVQKKDKTQAYDLKEIKYCY